MKEYNYNNQQEHKKLMLEMEGKPDKVVLIVSPCRSGSTALLNAFSMAGHDGIFQPIKAAIRRYMVGNDDPVKINAQKPIIAIKEALGPYTPAEIYYKPAHILKEKFNINSLAFIAMLRGPEECLNSWSRSFSRGQMKDFQPRLLWDAYAETLETFELAQREGVACAALRYDDLENYDLLAAALQEINVPFIDAMLSWKDSASYRPGEYAFQKPQEPELFQVSGLLEGTKYGTSLVATDQSRKKTQSISISDKEAKIAKLSEVQAIYREFSTLCVR